MLAVLTLLLMFITFAILAFVAKYRSVADLRKLPGPKPSILFGNTLQLTGEPHGKFSLKPRFSCGLDAGFKNISF